MTEDELNSVTFSWNGFKSMVVAQLAILAMDNTDSFAGRLAAMKGMPPFNHGPRVLITGAGAGVGLACAETLAARGAELILCDNDPAGLQAAAARLDASDHLFCDVASDQSVTSFAAAIRGRYSWLDMVLNAAGGGYQRTLGMYRVSRALLPLLGHGGDRLLVNVPPSASEPEIPIFPYASSRQAFHRLSSALALEARGTSIRVLIACPSTRRVTEVLPDPNAGSWAENCERRRPDPEDVLTLAWQVASLAGHHPAIVRHAS